MDSITILFSYKMFQQGSLLGIFLYSTIIRFSLAYLIFKYVPINPFWKSLFLFILDGFDINHMVIGYYENYFGCKITEKNSRIWNIFDKWSDFLLNVLYYRIVFEPIAPQYMKTIILFFLYYRLFGVILITIFQCKTVLLYFPDFINSSFIVFSFYLVYIKSNQTLLWILFILGIFIKIGIEYYLYKKYNHKTPCLNPLFSCKYE